MTQTETREERLARLAVCFAKKFAGRWRLGPGRWRELVGACWQGLSRAPVGLDGVAVERAAYRGVAEYLREIGGGGWGDTRCLPRRARSLAECHDRAVPAGEYGELEPVARPDADPARRLRELWAETRADRAGWTWRQRVWLYLFVVEGWSYADIAAFHEFDKSNVAAALSRVSPRGALRSLAGSRSL